MLMGEKKTGRNRDLRREKFEKSCCKEMEVITNQEINGSPVELGKREFRVALICQVVSLSPPVLSINYKNSKIGS